MTITQVEAAARHLCVLNGRDPDKPDLDGYWIKTADGTPPLWQRYAARIIEHDRIAEAIRVGKGEK